MERRICLVTGASGGIGLETARALGRDGAAHLGARESACPCRSLGSAEIRVDETASREVRRCGDPLLDENARPPRVSAISRVGLGSAEIPRLRDDEP